MNQESQLEAKSAVWRVLIVEDNPADVASIQLNLEKTRDRDGPAFFFGVAECLAEAMKLLARERFDLILLDLNLPDTVGGLDGLRVIRQSFADIPVIILTSLDPGWEFMGEAVAGGADDFINKDELMLRPLARIVGFALDRWHINVLRQQKEALEAKELAARQAKEKAEEESRRKTEFLALMSHEIRTPLNAVLGFAELLAKDEESGPDRQFAVEAFRRNGEALTRLLNDILDLAKVEAGHLLVETLKVSTADLVRNITAMMLPLALKKGLKFSISARTLVPEQMLTDPTRLMQILINIIGNAIKFTSAGFVHVELECPRPVGTDAATCLSFHVSDSGPGLTQQQQKKLFTIFSQADCSTTREFGGSGLGLELARRLARALGGDVIIAESVPGAGSTFTARIAVGLEAPELKLVPLMIGTGVEATATPPVPSPRPAALVGSRILIVDDTADNLRLVRRILERAGSSVSVAMDGFEGVEKALRDRPDLVLMDMRMPGMNGQEAAAELRRRGFRSPIIALTANAMAEERRQCLAAGCDDFLTKPIDHMSLVQRVGQLIGHAKLPTAVVAEPSTGGVRT
ncbi:MAG: response regulator [Proteobacteria bacterium]|nr:response regulator [Pseudomonadota bacterium]